MGEIISHKRVGVEPFWESRKLDHCAIVTHKNSVALIIVLFAVVQRFLKFLIYGL